MEKCLLPSASMSELQILDTSLFLWMNTGLTNPLFDFTMPIITLLGDKWAVWPEILLVALLCAPKAFHLEATTNQDLTAAAVSRLRLFLFLALLYGITAGMYSSVKVSVNRDRPFENSVGELRISEEKAKSISSNGSFPSGHTANAFMLATVLSVALPRLSLLFFCGALLVGLSRIYLGVHYPLDVLCGALFGATPSLLLLKTGWLAKLFNRV